MHAEATSSYCRPTVGGEETQRCQVRTRVLLSSIFFMADSVVRGNLTTAKASSFWTEGALQGSETAVSTGAP